MLEAVGPGVWAVDTGFQRPRFDAAYLISDSGRAAFVDTGPNAAVPRLRRALAEAGLQPVDVQWVILTHIHLDHAGGAGALLSVLPNAKLVVHPRGARHMADPSRLLAGVQAVYGEEVAARDYGELVPVPPERIVHAVHEMTLQVGRRRLSIADTPGHAQHHVCVWDEATQGWFSGDALGVSYPEFDFGAKRFGVPSTTPSQFDPEALCRSVEQLMARRPQKAYLTHFGAVHDVAAQAAQVVAQTRAMAAVAQEAALQPDTACWLRGRLRSLYGERIALTGGADVVEACLALLEGDIELNAQGLEVWLGKLKKQGDLPPRRTA